MSKTDIFKTLSHYKDVLEEQGYTVLYIGLYGSQNYNLDDEQSDIDCKAIILPTLHDIIFRKTTSKVIECENGSIDVKDLITFYNVIKKGNFSYIEAIDTEYSIGDKYLKELFKQIRPNLKSFLGAMCEKRKALTHEYPSKHEEFEKWGFDPKQYHHIVRLYDLMHCNIVNDTSYSYLKYNDVMARLMINLKRNQQHGEQYIDKEFAEKRSDEIIRDAKDIMPQDYKYEEVDLSDKIGRYIEKEIKKELYNTGVCYAREVRTFGNKISKTDIEKFPILKDYDGQDISYIVYENVEIL